MNEFSNQNVNALINSQQNLAGTAGGSSLGATNTLNSSSSQFSVQNVNNATLNSQNINSNILNSSTSSYNNSVMRDSVSSFQSYILSSSNTPNSPIERSSKPNRNKFRNIAQISSMFANYNSQTRPQNESIKLIEQLNSYLKELPKLPDEMNMNSYESSILDIEPDWNKFVGEAFSQSLPIKVAKQQMAIWELLVTECSHIKTTKIIIDVFLSCLINLKCSEQTSDLFKDIDIKKLFCNINEVFNCNLAFWQDYLHPIILDLTTSSSSTSSKNLLIDPTALVKGFSEFKKLFAPYEEFILEKNNSVDYFKLKLNENEHFNKFIIWAENNPIVGRLKTADFMMIPVQRLTKYQLLIEKIYQFTEDEATREQISQIKEQVNAFPNSINIKLSYIAQFNDISESIEKYEGINGPTDEITELLNVYKTVDIKSPLPGCLSTSIRELIHQGPLKLKDMSKPIDVHCFLFTDMLLITQQKKNKKYKIIKPPVSTSRMIVRELQQTDKAFVIISLNDYNVPDSVTMLISNQSKKWIELIEIAKKKYKFELEKSKMTDADQIQAMTTLNTAVNEKSLNLTTSSPTRVMTRQSASTVLTASTISSNSSSFTTSSNLVNRSQSITPNESLPTTFSTVNTTKLVDDLSGALTNNEVYGANSFADKTFANNNNNLNDDDGIDSSRRDSSATIKDSENYRYYQRNESLENEKEEFVQTDSNVVGPTCLASSSSSNSSSESSHSSLDLNDQTNSTNSKSLNCTSVKYQKQQYTVTSYNSRLLDRRIERQRRNMTDPTQHVSSAVASTPPDERHVIIMKRNSLNDKRNTSSNSNDLLENETKLINLCGDSTSTIMSTDSGMSSTSNCCDLNEIAEAKETPINYNAYNKQTSSSSAEPLSYSLPVSSTSSSSSSSSSNGSSKNDSLALNLKQLTGGKQLTNSSLLNVINSLNKNTERTKSDENDENSTVFVQDHDYKAKNSTSPHHHYDFTKKNSSQAFQYYDYVNRTTEDGNNNSLDGDILVHISSQPNTPTKSLPIQMSTTSTPNKFKFQHPPSTLPIKISTIDKTVHTTSSSLPIQHQQQQQRRPLIKIKSSTSTCASENLSSIRGVKSTIAVQNAKNESNKQLEFDRSIESAQTTSPSANVNTSSSSNVPGNNNSNNNNHVTLDNQHMMWVRLIQATMDATYILNK